MPLVRYTILHNLPHHTSHPLPYPTLRTYRQVGTSHSTPSTWNPALAVPCSRQRGVQLQSTQRETFTDACTSHHIVQLSERNPFFVSPYVVLTQRPLLQGLSTHHLQPPNHVHPSLRLMICSSAGCDVKAALTNEKKNHRDGSRTSLLHAETGKKRERIRKTPS
jgi:hypothetical protein